MLVRGLVAAGLLALVVVAWGGWRSSEAEADPEISGYPDSIAALGDSITRAANTGTAGDHPEESWSTGTDAAVNSVYSRLLVLNPAIAGNRFNDAVSGARMVHANGQAANAVSQNAELVTILMGANDVCTGTEASMTPVATFQTQFEATMATLSAGLPNSRIAVGSIPSIYNLWDILHTDATAVSRWTNFGICQSMLLNATSMAPADVQRRENVKQRNIDFNNVLQNVCAQYIHCHFDNFAGFNAAYQPQHVSLLDYFHPSIAGQALAAQVGWDDGYDLTDLTAPVSTSSGTAMAGTATMPLSATDNTAVSGIEYKLGGGWVRYTAPLSLATGTTVTWRAVDTSGNIDATTTCRIQAWNWPAGDGDCDGSPSTVGTPAKAAESFLGTNGSDACANTPAANDEAPPDAWPMDFNDDRSASIVDISTYSSTFGANAAGGAPYNVRQDLNGDEVISIIDISQYSAVFGKVCLP